MCGTAGGIRTSLVIKAVRFSVDMNTPEGVSSAKQMLVDGGVESADADIQLFRLKLLVAILDRNVKDANESWLKLGISSPLKIIRPFT